MDVAAEDPHEILRVHDGVALGLGELGAFDDAGAMPSWVIRRGEEVWLYTVGWNAGVSVPYRNAIGLAISRDNGESFERPYRGAIMDRDRDDPHFLGCSCVLVDAGLFRMYYQSTERWVVHDGHPEPYYDIKYAESDDGLTWRRPGVTCIALQGEEGGITRPCVIPIEGGMEMWYSTRAETGFRNDPSRGYRLGRAWSSNGVHWHRADDSFEIVDEQADLSGWDSDMMAYAHVYVVNGRRHMLYNGNGFGQSGIGHAVEVD